MSEADFIAKIKPLLPQGRRASDEALWLVSKALSAFPESAELWLLHGWVTMAASDNDVSDAAVRSFEMAIKINPSMTEAQDGICFFRNAKQARREIRA